VAARSCQTLGLLKCNMRDLRLRPATLAKLGLQFFCAATAGLANAQCYSLYDVKNILVLQTQRAPVNLANDLSEEVQRAFPGHNLIVTDNTPCTEVDELTARNAPIKLPAQPLNRGPIALNAGGESSFGPYGGSDSSNAHSASRGAGRSSSSRTRAGADIHVKSYTRSDGTDVLAHTRS
jgi:hypothetical protein